jgi:hypothetical protein
MTATGGEEGGKPNDWDDGLPEDQPFETTPFDEVEQAAASRLPLNDEDRLPWLESPDDVELEDDGVDAGRIVGFIVLGVVALALLLGAVYWLSRGPSGPAQADGSLIEASKDPYKVKPEDAGGKVFEGTGDTSFKVSEGLRPQGSVGADAVPTPPPLPGPSASPTKAPAAQAAASPAAAAPAAASAAGATGGVGVQIGAFSSKAAAEAAWSKFQGQYESLKGVGHRVIEAKADIGTVYRLQAVAGDVAAARTLCSALSAGGLKCQVK